MRILFIDDNKDILDCIGPCFESYGHEVIPVLGGEAAIIAIAKMQFDLIVSDREMPVVNGLMLAQMVKDSGASTPFILYTGAPDLSEAELKRLNITAMYDKTQIAQLLDDLKKIPAC